MKIDNEQQRKFFQDVIDTHTFPGAMAEFVSLHKQALRVAIPEDVQEGLVKNRIDAAVKAALAPAAVVPVPGVNSSDSLPKE